MLRSFWWLLERDCSQTNEFQAHQFVPNISISGQCVSTLWTILQPFPGPPSWSDGRQGVENFIQLFYLFIRQHTLSFNALFRMTFHIVWPRDSFCVKLLPPRQYSVVPAENSWFEDPFCTTSKLFRSVYFHVECIPNIRDQEMKLVRQDPRFFINFFHIGLIFFFPPAIWISSTYTDKSIPCFRWTNRHSQFGTFSHPSPNRTSSNCLSHKRPASGCPYKFRWRSVGVFVRGFPPLL